MITSLVPMVDLVAQYRRYKEEIDDAVMRTIASGRFIMGPEVEALQQELADYCGARHAVCCSSGTDALVLALMALGVGPGDEVIVPDFTFIGTAESVSLVGATPVFADVRVDDFGLDPARLAAHISPRTCGVIAVSLFGQCPDMTAIARICAERGLFLLEDGAQSFGSSLGERRSGALSEIATTSFYPSKPLGGYGEGGAVFTSDARIAERVRQLVNHGQIAPYVHRYIGMNGRLDALQAAILRVKLRHLDEELEARRKAAQGYDERLEQLVATPRVLPGRSSSWAQYTIRIPGSRDLFIEKMKSRGTSTAVYYPVPLHCQEAFSDLPSDDAAFPTTNSLCAEVVSLPMHAFIPEEELCRIADNAQEALNQL